MLRRTRVISHEEDAGLLAQDGSTDDNDEENPILRGSERNELFPNSVELIVYAVNDSTAVCVVLVVEKGTNGGSCTEEVPTLLEASKFV